MYIHNIGFFIFSITLCRIVFNHIFSITFFIITFNFVGCYINICDLFECLICIFIIMIYYLNPFVRLLILQRYELPWQPCIGTEPLKKKAAERITRSYHLGKCFLYNAIKSYLL